VSSVRNTETKAKRAERVLSNQRRVLEGVMAVEEIVAAIMNAPDRRVSYRGAVILIQVSQCKGMATLSELMGVGDLCAESLVRGYALIAGEDRAEQYQKKVEHQLERNREKIARSRLFRSGCFPLASLLMAESEDGVQAGVYFAGLFDFVMKHGTDALSTLRMLYVVVKALKEELIGGMSLHSLAALSCDKGRQTTSARVLRDYNRFVEGDSGVIVKAPYQKSEKTVQKYREAQKGNKNRIKGRRRRKLG